MSSSFRILLTSLLPEHRGWLADALRQRSATDVCESSEAELYSELISELPDASVICLEEINKSSVPYVVRLRSLVGEGPILVIGRLEQPSLAAEIIRAGADELILTPAVHSAVISAVVCAVERAVRKDVSAVCSRTGEEPQVRGLFQLLSTTAGVSFVVESIVDLSRGYIGTSFERHLKLTLHEAVRNGFEHGNLGLSSEEKGALCEAGEFDAEVSKRELQTSFRDRPLRVGFSISRSSFECTIEDVGSGFDWRKNFSDESQTTTSTKLHGRGIHLMRSFYDELFYNESGNFLTLRKRLNS